MKCVIYITHVIIHTMILNHVKILIIFISQMGVFQGVDHKYVIELFTNNHFEMNSDEYYELG